MLSITRSATYVITSKLGLSIIDNRPFTFVVIPKAALCRAPPSACNTVVVGEMDSFLAGSARSMWVTHEVVILNYLISFFCRLLASFDEYFNLADPKFEEYKVSYSSAKDGSLFQDVAVSYSIIQNIALHSIYFFSSSDDLILSISHNGTRIPSSNFIRRSTNVEEFLNTLEQNGFKSLFDDQSISNLAAPSTITFRSFEPTQSNESASNVSIE